MLKYSMHLPHPLDSSLRSLLWLGGRVPGMCPRSHTDVPRTLHVQRNRGDARPEQQTPHRDSPYVLVRTLAPSASSQLLLLGAKRRKRQHVVQDLFVLFFF